jgi:hypothetical protein
MKNFDVFVDQIVNDWLLDKKYILESYGLGSPANWETGDSSEEYILRKIKGLPQNYIAKRSRASKSPVDVFAVARRGRYWHIMLIQVKSSKNADSIYKLNKNDQEIMNEFGKYFKKKLMSNELLKQYKNSSITISTGYAGVYKDLRNNKHYLKETKLYKTYKSKMTHMDNKTISLNVNTAHKL